MLNQLNTIDDLMTRLEFHADQSAKRRKLLFVDPFEVDDTNDGIEKLTIFRVRKSEARPLYEYSTWGRMLMNPRTQDPTDKKGGVLFRRRFRVPFPVFLRLVALTRENNWFTERPDASGRRGAPLELKILGVLRVLGRG